MPALAIRCRLPFLAASSLLAFAGGVTAQTSLVHDATIVGHTGGPVPDANGTPLPGVTFDNSPGWAPNWLSNPSISAGGDILFRNGCANSIDASGGNLAASGSNSLAGDTLFLAGSGMPSSSALYSQGTSQQNGGLGNPFGDGLRCAGGAVTRLKTVTGVGGASQYPQAGEPPVPVRGLATTPGVRTYQVWYRNAAAFCTPSTFDLTNGVQVTWQS